MRDEGSRVTPSMPSNSVTTPPATPSNGAPKPAPAAPQPSPKSAEAESNAPTSEQVARRWSDFSEFLKTKSRPLHSILPDIEFCGIRRSIVYLGTPGKIERDMLFTMKDEMSRALSEFFGAPVGFEAGPKADMHAKAGSPVIAVPMISAPAMDGPKPNAGERSSLEVALMEKFGAQEV